MTPFSSGRKSVATSALRPAPGMNLDAAVSAPQFRSAAATVGRHAHGAARVEAIKEGDKVVSLVVTCACGERIEVQCLYPVKS